MLKRRKVLPRQLNEPIWSPSPRIASRAPSARETENPLVSIGVTASPEGRFPRVQVQFLGDSGKAPVSIGLPNEYTDTEGMGDVKASIGNHLARTLRVRIPI